MFPLVISGRIVTVYSRQTPMKYGAVTHVTLTLLIDATRARVRGITKKPVTSVTGWNLAAPSDRQQDLHAASRPLIW